MALEVSEEEKKIRREWTDNVLKSMAEEGIELPPEEKEEFERYARGEISFGELKHNDKGDIDEEERQRRKEIVKDATASMALEGFKMMERDKVLDERFISGEINLEEYVKEGVSYERENDLHCSKARIRLVQYRLDQGY